MVRIFSFLVLCVFFTSQSFAASRIVAAEYMPLARSLIVYAETDGKYYISSVSLSACRESSRTPALRASNAVISKYISPFVISGFNSLNVFDTVTRKKEQTISSFTRAINIIAQSDDGAYVAATDALSVELFMFQKDKLVSVFRKEFAGGVTGVYPDAADGKLYVAESNGWISVWSFSGILIKNINIPSKIKALLNDERGNRLLALTNDALLTLSKSNDDNETLLKGRMNGISLDGYSNRLIVSSQAGTTAYDMFTMRTVLLTQDIGKAAASDGGNFIGIISKNRVKIYDTKLNRQIGEIELSDKGVTFLPVRFDTYGAMPTGDFIVAAAGGKPVAIQSDPLQICAPLAAMVSGVYSPSSIQTGDVALPDVDGVRSPNAMQVKDPFAVPSPSVADVSVPSIAIPELNSEKVKNPASPNVKDNTKSPKTANIGDINYPKAPDEIASGKTPSWVANRKNLPKNNVVKNGATAENAFKDAKNQLKNDIVKQALRIAVEYPEVKNLDDINLKKRVLWQIAANTASLLERNIHMAESWKTPAGQFFVLAVNNADNRTLSDASTGALLRELEALGKLGAESYMAQKPVQID